MTTETDIKKQVKRALEDEKPQSRLREKKKATARQKRKRYLIFAGLGLFCYVFYLLLIPYKGGLNYGVCKVFLELYVKYPETLSLSTVEDFGDSYRIWFTHIDEFGQYRLDNMQCFYRSDETTGFALERVSISRRPIDQDIVDAFNPSIPVIAKFPPDLTLPSPLPDSLRDIEILTNDFRRKIFN